MESTADAILADLRTCLAVAKTRHCQDLLSAEVAKIEKDQEAKAQPTPDPSKGPTDAEPKHPVSTAQQSSQTAPAEPIVIPEGTKDQVITKYAWDQSDKFVTLYITLPGDRDLVETEFPDDRTAILYVHDFKAKKRHLLKLVNLCQPINTAASKALNKKSDVVFKLKKATASETWSALDDSVDKKKAAREKRMKSELKDASTMELIADMYKHGDDETRKSLKDAMAKNQQVRAERGEIPKI